jgi:hypothetical protein
MTSVACMSIDWGIVSPRSLAVFRLITKSNLVGCSTGSSPGLAPFKILSTKVAAGGEHGVRVQGAAVVRRGADLGQPTARRVCARPKPRFDRLSG